MASEADKQYIPEGESGRDSSLQSLRGVGRTTKLLAALAFVMSACEGGSYIPNGAETIGGDTHADVYSALNEEQESVIDKIQVMADHKGVQLFGNLEDVNEPVKISLKLLGQSGEVLEEKDHQVGPGQFNVVWNFSTLDGHKVQMTDENGKGSLIDLDAGSKTIPDMPKQND